MNLIRRAGKNILWLLISEVCSRGFAFVATLYLARVLGIVGFGLYSLGIAMGFALWGITDAGVTGYGLREVAKDRNRAGELLSALNSMRIFASVLILVAISIALYFLEMPNEKKYVLLAGALFIFTHAIYPDWVFQGLEEMKYLALGKLAVSLSFLAAILMIVKDPSKVFIAVLFYSLSQLIGGIILLYILKSKFKISFALTVSIAQWWMHLRESFFFFSEAIY